jgi:hypothetical protein
MGSPAWIDSLTDAGVKADLLNDDGTLTYAEALQLLTDVANRGAVTAAEFSSLQTIAANLNNGLSASAYVATAFTQIVDGSPANATWDGGSATPVALGNLEVGSTSAQLSELIGKWLLGTDLPDPTLPAGSAYYPPEPSYSAVVGPLYGSTGAASVADICQGADGTCELLADLIDVVENHPQLLGSMFVDNGNGTYGVRFFVNGNEIWETVNDQLPTSIEGLEYAHNYDWQNTALWAPLLEKAYAQLSATGLIGHPAVNSYNNIFGNTAYEALKNLTGCTDVTYYFSSSGDWYNDKTIFLDALANGDDVVLETGASSSYTYDSSGNIELVPDHAFGVIGYDSATGDFIVRNPWGYSYSEEIWDPQFEVSLAQIAAVDGDFAIDNSGTNGSTITVTAASQEILSSGSPIAGFFKATNSTGAPITQYMLQTDGSVSIDLNGAVNLATAAETAEGQVVISASDLSKVTVSGSASETGDLLVSASDGSSWSAATDIPLTVSAGVALTQPLDLAIAPGATVPLSSLFNVSGTMAAGAWIEVNLRYETTNGALNLNGATNNSSVSTLFFFPAAQLPLVTYTAPTSNETPQLQFIVDSGGTWSPWLTENLTLGVSTAAEAAQDYENGQFAEASQVVDTAANIFANLDGLEDGFAAGALQTIALSDSTPQVEPLSAYDYSRDRGVLSVLSGNYSLNIVDWATLPQNFFNNDDTADILWRNTNGDVELWNSNSSSGGFTYENLGVVNTNWQIGGTGDFSGTGEVSILWRNANGDTELWNPDGSGGFTYQALGIMPSSWQIAGTGDFTGTGKVGILWRNANGDTELWNPNGSAGFTDQDLGVMPSSWQIAGTGDFTGTGEDSILWRNTNGDTELWNPSGSGGLTSEDLGVVNTNWQIAGNGDFTGTGEDSILWRNTNGDTELWNPNGSGGFTYENLGVVNTSWQIVETGDFSGDGQSGILWRNANGGTELWNPNGAGGFAYENLGVVNTSWSVQKIFA